MGVEVGTWGCQAEGVEAVEAGEAQVVVPLRGFGIVLVQAELLWLVALPLMAAGAEPAGSTMQDWVVPVRWVVLVEY